MPDRTGMAEHLRAELILAVQGAYTDSMADRPEKETKSERLNLRVTPSDAQLISRAASELDMTVSEFVVSSSHDRAMDVIADRTRIVVSEEEYDRFVESLERPPRWNPRLAALMAMDPPDLDL